MDDNIILFVIFFVLLIGVGAVCAVLVHKAEREKEEAKRQLSDAKTDFLSRISNDIKTPMNVIVGMTALGMEETDNPEKMAECLGKIDTASRFLMGLLNDLVDVSMIEMGRFRLHPRAYSMSGFMESISDMMKPACEEKQIAFRMTGDEINLNIMADPMRFEQMFFNLLNNAVKFTPAGGEVNFRVCNYATHGGVFSADYVVEDTGFGMSSEFQKLLFEPFTQEKCNEAEKRHGSGLRLAIVQNIVSQMGGTIAVRSALGSGTEVKIHLDIPLADIQPEKASGRGGRTDGIGEILYGKRVLLAEDHPLNIEIAKRILESQKMEVVCAENGHEAVELFEKMGLNYFDVILLCRRWTVLRRRGESARCRGAMHRLSRLSP